MPVWYRFRQPQQYSAFAIVDEINEGKQWGQEAMGTGSNGDTYKFAG